MVTSILDHGQTQNGHSTWVQVRVLSSPGFLSFCQHVGPRPSQVPIQIQRPGFGEFISHINTTVPHLATKTKQNKNKKVLKILIFLLPRVSSLDQLNPSLKIP